MAPTGTLKVIAPEGTQTFQWNGVQEDRDAARRVFENLAGSGSYLATVIDAPGKAHAVTSFSEIEQVEKERGFVEAKIQPALVGG